MADPSHLLIYHFSTDINQDAAKELAADPRIIEKTAAGTDVLYAHYPNGGAESKLTTAYIDKVLRVPSTGRNLNTIRALLKK